MKIKFSIFIFSLLLSFPGQTVTARENVDIDYDLAKINDSLAVWIDLASFINSNILENLKDGIDFSIFLHVNLNRPKKLFGTENIAKTDFFVDIKYRILTQNFVIITSDAENSTERTVISPAQLHRYLNDSIYIYILPEKIIDPENRYELEVDIDCLSAVLVGNASNKPTENNSALKYLFNRFLEFSSYGRTEYQIKSRPFRMTDLDSSFTEPQD